jgi:ribonuclease P protein component
LKRRSEFLAVYDEGIRVSGDVLMLFVRPREQDGPRIGLTAGKRMGGAVERNRARRRVREAFRRHRDQFGAWDLVVNFRVGAANRTAVAVESEFLALVRRARRILAGRAQKGRA